MGKAVLLYACIQLMMADVAWDFKWRSKANSALWKGRKAVKASRNAKRSEASRHLTSFTAFPRHTHRCKPKDQSHSEGQLQKECEIEQTLGGSFPESISKS